MTGGPRIYNGERINSSVNGGGKTGREWNWTPTVHHTQESTQNGLKTWIKDLQP